VGIIGIAIGVAPLRMDVEKLDQYSAILGIVLSVAPIMCAVVLLFRNKM